MGPFVKLTPFISIAVVSAEGDGSSVLASDPTLPVAVKSNTTDFAPSMRSE